MKTKTRALLFTKSFRQGHAVREMLRATRPGVSLEIVRGQSAFTEAIRNRPHVILLDNTLVDSFAPDPVETGRITPVLIRQCASIPVIVLSVADEDQATHA